MNGNGRAVLPPGALSPVTFYRQPPRRYGRLQLAAKVGGWFMATIVLLVGGVAGGIWLWLDHTVQATAPHSKDVIKAAEQLHTVPPNKPAVALVLGYDKRFGEVGPSRSDTIMLIRADPQLKAISLMSFPRDLLVDIRCPGGVSHGIQKINAAYAYCKAPGTVATVSALTGLQINYLITVNFRGFTQVVDKLGGVWMDVDRRYFHSNVGTVEGSEERYAEINLQPGYQRLNGANALAFVRYRHADDDTYRNARQQQFIKAVRQQIHASISISDVLRLARIVNAITHNVEIAKAGRGAPSTSTILSYASFAYGLPPGHVFQVDFDVDFQGFDLVSAPGALEAAVREFQNPDVDAPLKAGSQVLRKRLGRRSSAPLPHQTTVAVLNGNGVAGSAALASSKLDGRGYRIVYPPSGDAPQGTCPTMPCFKTRVFFNPAKKRSRAAAKKVAGLFGTADVFKLPPLLTSYASGSMVLVVVGQTFHGNLAPGPIDRTAIAKEPPQVRRDWSLLNELKRRRHKVPFRLEVPTVLEKSSHLSSDRGIRTYRIIGDKKAVRMTFQIGDTVEYWGIEQTNWDEAPVLSDANFPNKIKGRQYSFYWNGPKLHMVVLHENGATYWVVNSLLDRLSPQTMVAIAKGLVPLPDKQKKRKKK